MSPIEQIRASAHKNAHQELRVLLIAGGPFSNAIGDTVLFAYHTRYLRLAFGDISLTVWNTDGAVWRSLSECDVLCTPFIGEAAALHGYALVLFDRVPLSPTVEELYSRSRSTLIEITRDGRHVRYRIPDCKWEWVVLPPLMNHPSRLAQVYRTLGVAIQDDSRSSPSRVEDKARRVFLNPYASCLEKYLDYTCFDCLARTIKNNNEQLELICPSPPLAESIAVEEEQGVWRLVEVAFKAERDGVLRIAQRMTAVEYIQYLKSFKLVIGGDTSTQHIACYFKVPSIACYPEKSGYRYHFWGNRGSKSVSLRMPSPSQPKQVIDFASLVAELANVLCSNAAGVSVNEANLSREYVAICGSLATGEVSPQEGRKALDCVIATMRGNVAERWHAFIFPELETVAEEICVRATLLKGRSVDEMSLERLNDISALKTVAMLNAATIIK